MDYLPTLQPTQEGLQRKISAKCCGLLVQLDQSLFVFQAHSLLVPEAAMFRRVEQKIDGCNSAMNGLIWHSLTLIKHKRKRRCSAASGNLKNARVSVFGRNWSQGIRPWSVGLILEIAVLSRNKMQFFFIFIYNRVWKVVQVIVAVHLHSFSICAGLPLQPILKLALNKAALLQRVTYFPNINLNMKLTTWYIFIFIIFFLPTT